MNDVGDVSFQINKTCASLFKCQKQAFVRVARTCRRTSLINIRMTGMVEAVPCNVSCSKSSTKPTVWLRPIPQGNGGPRAAAGRQVRREEVELQQVERSHSEPGVQGGGGLQAETQILLHEPLWEIPSQGSQTLETVVTNTKSRHHHSSGITQNSG